MRLLTNTKMGLLLLDLQQAVVDARQGPLDGIEITFTIQMKNK